MEGWLQMDLEAPRHQQSNWESRERSDNHQLEDAVGPAEGPRSDFDGSP